MSAHWGGNWGSEVPAAHRRLARSLIEAGADVVFGHSAHIFRGVEIYRNRPIVYSAAPPGTRRSAPHMLRLYPTEITRLQTRLARRSAAKIAERMQRLSTQLGTRSSWIGGDKVLDIPTGPEPDRTDQPDGGSR